MSEPTMKVELVDSFFMIWTKGGWKPRKVHGTIDAARKEAERLAGLNPGKKFLLLAGFEKVWTEPEAPLGGPENQVLAGSSELEVQHTIQDVRE